jgi:hypothetical protein
MPRNSAGVYTIPNVFVPNTAISSTAMNANFADIAQALSESLWQVGGVAWTIYTPVFSPLGGTLTSAVATGRYFQIGKTVIFKAELVITTNGSAAGVLLVSLPSQAANTVRQVLSSRSNASGGNQTLIAHIPANATQANISLGPSGGYPGGDGITVSVSGAYEAA